MVERTSRRRVGAEPRSATGREWEVFVRANESSPLQSVGSVSAPDPETAHEQATDLFAWAATELWLCPAAEVVRYVSHDLDDAAHGHEDADAAPPEP